MVFSGSFSVLVLAFQWLVWFHQGEVEAFEMQLGRCPEPLNRMTDFDLTKYLGTWFQQKTDVKQLSTFGRCSQQILTQNDTSPGQVDIKNKMKLDLGYAHYFYNYVVEGFAKPVEGEVGKLEVSLNVPAVGWQKAPLWILRTDYENYAIVSSCREFNGFFNIQTGFILSRTSTPPANFTEVVNEQLAELKMKPSDFFQLNQKDCELN